MTLLDYQNHVPLMTASQEHQQIDLKLTRVSLELKTAHIKAGGEAKIATYVQIDFAFYPPCLAAIQRLCPLTLPT